MSNKTKESKNITLNGTEFIVYKFTGRNTLKMLEKITKIILPIGASIYEALDDNSKISGIDNAIRAAYESLGIDQAYPFIKELLSETRIGSREIDDLTFDSEFSGNMKSLFMLIKFIIKDVNYNDFFGEGGIGQAIQELSKKAKAIT